MSEMLIYLDGELVPREAAKVSVFDHGLLYGDGVFEGIRVYNRRVFRLDAHLDRLYDSARALALAIPLARAELAEAVRTTVRANRREDGYIRLIVTRGVGDLGVDPRSCPRPRPARSRVSRAARSSSSRPRPASRPARRGSRASTSTRPRSASSPAPAPR